MNVFDKTCTVIIESNPKNIKKKLEAVLKESKYAEIRLDCIQPKNIPITINIIKKNIHRCIFTLRDNKEGGKFSGNDDQKIKILKNILRYKPFLLDIEYEFIIRNKNFLTDIKSSNVNILISWHDFNKTPKKQVLNTKLNNMKKISHNIKIVTTANSLQDNIKILSLYEKCDNINLITFAMNEYGKISRLLCMYFGPFTYISTNKQSSLGQFNINKLKSIFKNL